MIVARCQLPVHSRLTVRQLLRGASAVLGVGHDPHSPLARLRSSYDVAGALGTASGTIALQVALRLVAGPTRAPIALPGYGCYDLATAAIGADVPVRLYDIDPRTLGPDLDELGRIVAEGAGAIVVVHQYGIAVDMAAVRALAAEAGIPVVEDAAQAVGGRLAGRALGGLGDYGILSFGRGKGMSAAGGGALLARRSAEAMLLSSTTLISPGSAGAGDLLRGAAQFALGRPATYSLPAALPFLRLGETVYHSPQGARGWSRAVVAMLDGALDRVDAESARRRTRGAELQSLLPERAQLGTSLPANAEAGYLRLPCLVPRREVRDDALAGGVPFGVARGYPRTLADLAELAPQLASAPGPLPGARELASRLVTLPTHDLLTVGDLAALKCWIHDRL